ncbi:MAG TPA: NAD(P)-dependent oxidoreductase [Candidatus Eremiobacteraeota bacterium]|nr:MAG: 3 beta-hydroxysteroid dehydrogenase/Delta 5-->4-isomerase [bacterium ADurb.Bin363]HPZ09213.1 NAD(P)-dependent oxidoreductase [Candidatus Eremiobacteraeota bacterium]
MKILITGGTGFVGKRLTEILLSDGNYVRCIVRESSNISNLDKRIEILRGNLFDNSFFKSALLDIDVVFHLAALRGEKYLPYKEYEKANVLLTGKLLEASRNIRKFIFCSTVGVMGFGTDLNENSPLKPKGNYHISKARAEELCRKYENCIIVRPSIVYGPGDIDGFLYKLIRLIKRKRFLITGNGKNKIHMVHIDNLCQGLIKVGLNGKTGETFIIADRNSLTLSEIIEIIGKELNVRIPSLMIPRVLAFLVAFIYQKFYSLIFPEKEPFVSLSKVDIMSLNQDFNVSKALSMGYNPEIEIQKGIEETVREYKKREK